MESIDKVSGTYEKHCANLQKAYVSPAVIRRLPRYHRYLGDLLREGKMRISSSALSKIMNVTASQIRQDLNCFGGFGQQGYGYNIKYLHTKIGELLGVTEGYTAVIIGAGNLGKALAATHMFERRGVERLAMFDVDPAIVGGEICGLPVLHIDALPEFFEKTRVDIAVLTVPKEKAHDIASMIDALDIGGIWNFANMELRPEDYRATVENIHLGDSLMTLCYELKVKREGEK